jgi:transposase
LSALLVAAKYVRAYLKGQKNDFRDAEAIAEAVQRPTMNFVATKTADHLDQQALHRCVRLVRQRTGIINQIRAFLLERGVRCARDGASAHRIARHTCQAFRRAVAAHDRGSGRRLAPVETLLREVLAGRPQRVDALVGLAHVARCRGDRAGSLAAFQAAAAANRAIY